MNPVALVKAHPVLTIGGVVGAVILVLLLTQGGGQAEAVTYSGSPVDPNSAINAQVSMASMQVDAAKQVALNENATKLQLAQLSVQAAQAEGERRSILEELSLQVQETLGLRELDYRQAVDIAGIGAQERVSTAGLAAQTQIADYGKQVQLAGLEVQKTVSNNQTATLQAQSAASAAAAAANERAAAAMAAAQQEQARILANAQVEQARIAAQPKGLLSWLFG